MLTLPSQQTKSATENVALQKMTYSRNINRFIQTSKLLFNITKNRTQKKIEKNLGVYQFGFRQGMRVREVALKTIEKEG